MALMLVGILFKVSAAPFHVWTPDVYEGAPSPVVALLSTAPKAAAFALLLRVVYEMFPSLRALWAPLLWVVAVLSMTVGNLAALRQQNVKRMLAYSSIAHAGYLLAAFAGLGTSGIAAASFYTAAYAAMNVGIFAVITLVSGYDDKLPMIDDFRGLIYRSPLLGGLLLLLSGFAGRHSLYRRILRQVLLVLGGGRWRSDLTGHHWPAEFRAGGCLLSAPGAGGGRTSNCHARTVRDSDPAGGGRRWSGFAVGGCRHTGSWNCPRRGSARCPISGPHAAGSAS